MSVLQANAPALSHSWRFVSLLRAASRGKWLSVLYIARAQACSISDINLLLPLFGVTRVFGVQFEWWMRKVISITWSRIFFCVRCWQLEPNKRKSSDANICTTARSRWESDRGRQLAWHPRARDNYTLVIIVLWGSVKGRGQSVWN